MLEVFATSRAIRSFYDTFLETNTLLPKAMSIAEFEQKIILVPHYALVDEDMRVLLMQEASRFTTFELLHIEREFFSFLKNSTYLFRFYEELAYERVSIETLMNADTYEHYHEHLEVLQTLLKQYKALLSKHGVYDRITLPEHYELNTSYIHSLGAVRIHLEGFLSRFEMDLLMHVATCIPVSIILNVTSYNQKMTSYFQEWGLPLAVNHTYEIDLSSKKILHAHANQNVAHSIQVHGFSSRIAQVAYIHNTIAQYVHEGLLPEEIVVVLPDESMAATLQAFDTWHNLNFAMGVSIKNSSFYQRLSAVENVMRHDDIEDHLRIHRLNIAPEVMEKCKELWHQKLSSDDAIDFFKLFLDETMKEEQKRLFQEAFFAFHHFLANAPLLRLEQLTKLFLNRLSVLSQDDVQGGKVTVLGVLETRGVAYKGVIVVDFNDDFIPRRSQKDLFLSSSVRAFAGLPTKSDRENLQRYYYHQLFSKAQKIAISYVKNETSMPSRFLDELHFAEGCLVDERILHEHLFASAPSKIRYEEAFIDAPYDLRSSPLSATKLKTLLGCKRHFYFRYVAKIKEAKMPSTKIDEQSIGIVLHKVLQEAIDAHTLVDEKTLYQRLEYLLKEHNRSEVWGYFADVWLEKLKPFIAHEVKRFYEGYRVAKKEYSDKVLYKGFVLEGQIDRIDEKEGSFFIMDYKSGKVPTTTERSLESTKDFQLIFYTLIAQKMGHIGGAYYYDLKNGALLPELFMEEKLALLESVLEQYQEPINGYELCEEVQQCRLCPYVLLCGREELV